jgi:hypothetical protein
MPNGKPGDHPITDLLHYRRHPFPEDIEALVWQLAKLLPVNVSHPMWASIYERAWNWETQPMVSSTPGPDKKRLDEDRQWLQAQLRRLEE